MNGPVAAAVAGNPVFAKQYSAFRSAAYDALGEELTAHVHHAVAQVHGMESNAPAGEAPSAILAYAKRIPFEHTAITDAEAAEIVAAIGEKGYVALSVVAALADAECRAERVDLAGLTAV